MHWYSVLVIPQFDLPCVAKVMIFASPWKRGAEFAIRCDIRVGGDNYILFHCMHIASPDNPTVKNTKQSG